MIYYLLSRSSSPNGSYETTTLSQGSSKFVMILTENLDQLDVKNQSSTSRNDTCEVRKKVNLSK